MDSNSQSTRYDDERSIRAGRRILVGAVLVFLAIAVVGSLLFLLPRFDTFPYAWF